MKEEKNFNDIFSRKLRYFLNFYEMNQAQLAKRLGVGTTTVSEWCNGKKTPRMDKIDAMCRIFHCKRSDFLTDQKDGAHTPAYYTDPETAKVAQEIYDNKELRVLFDAARNASSEDLATATNVLKALLAKERGSEDAD